MHASAAHASGQLRHEGVFEGSGRRMDTDRHLRLRERWSHGQNWDGKGSKGRGKVYVSSRGVVYTRTLFRVSNGRHCVRVTRGSYHDRDGAKRGLLLYLAFE